MIQWAYPWTFCGQGVSPTGGALGLQVVSSTWLEQQEEPEARSGDYSLSSHVPATTAIDNEQPGSGRIPQRRGPGCQRPVEVCN
jgi:hypothetical protein